MYVFFYLALNSFLDVLDHCLLLRCWVFDSFLHVDSNGDFYNSSWSKHGEVSLSCLLNFLSLLGFIIKLAVFKWILILNTETYLAILYHNPFILFLRIYQVFDSLLNFLIQKPFFIGKTHMIFLDEIVDFSSF